LISQGVEESIDLLNEAIERLKVNFMTMSDLERAGKVNELIIEEGPFGYDHTFMMKYPEHPMSRGRFTRINGADQIMRLSKEREHPYPESVLEHIHISLFDCCAAVRHSLAIALYNAGNVSSIPLLETLIEQETESKMVKEEAEKSLQQLKNKYIKRNKIETLDDIVNLFGSDGKFESSPQYPYNSDLAMFMDLWFPSRRLLLLRLVTII